MATTSRAPTAGSGYGDAINQQTRPGDVVRSVSSPTVVFALALGAMTLMPLAVTGTNLAFPDIERGFDDTSRATLSWALSGYSISVAAFQLLGGQLSDRFDARRIFGLGLLTFGIASLLSAVAPNPATLIGGRVLQGAGGALVVPASLVITTAQYPPERHPTVIGIWTAAFPLGAALAPTVAAVVLETGSWRSVFVATAVAALTLAAVTTTLRMRAPVNTASRDSGTPDYLGIVAGTAAVALLTLGVVQGPAWGWASTRVIGVLAAAGALVAFSVRRAKQHPRPLLDPDLFRIPTFAVASVANVFISTIGMATWLVWPLVMTNEWGYSRVAVGLAITPTPAIAGTTSILSMRWAARHGYRGLMTTGSAVLALANLFYVVRLEPQADYLGAMLPGLVLYGIGMGLTFAPVNAAALVDVPAEKYGQANAGFSTGRFLSGAIGIAATFAALGDGTEDPFVGYDRAFTLLAIASIGAVAVVAIFWPRRPTTEH